MSVTIIVGDSRSKLLELDTESVQCCVTSPPYFGLRDYGHDEQMGRETSPEQYVDGMVRVFAQIKRILRDDGTLWLNIGDSYATRGKRAGGQGGTVSERSHLAMDYQPRTEGRKDKDLIGIPWMLAFALRADGWYLRSDIIWHKPNPMPESVTDRPSKAHEYVFLLSKSEKYFYDAAAIAEPLAAGSLLRLGQPNLSKQVGSTRVPGKTNGTMKAVWPRIGGNLRGDDESEQNRTASGNTPEINAGGRNSRTVWTIATQPFKSAHFATMAPMLAERCIKAGTKLGDTVIDPFGGAGTTGLAADRLGRNAVLIEINKDYAELASRRLHKDAPLFSEVHDV